MDDGWATQFQNLHIAGPSPVPPVQIPPAIPAQGGWHNEFLNYQRQQQQQPQPQMPINHMQAHQFAAHHGSRPLFSYPVVNPLMNIHQAALEFHPSFPALDNQSIEAAFDAEFVRVLAEVEEVEAALDICARDTEEYIHELEAMPGLSTEEGQRLLREQLAARTPVVTNHAQQTSNQQNSDQQNSDPQTSDPQTIEPESQQSAHDADAFAETAGELLDSVRGDQSDKFQQSEFLALMRRIRDREVEVNGDELREVSSNP